MPDVATFPTIPAGLFAGDRAGVPVPLTGVTIDGTITGLCARVSVAHRYRNAESTPIEAVYLFPLDEGAAVCGFEAVIDGTVVTGTVVERERAFEVYDEALEQGHGAFLLDEERADVFRASIGNLPPGKEVLVRLTYVSELAVDEGRVRFTVPTTIAPKYAPAADQRGVGRSEAEAVNPPVEWQVPYGLHLTLRMEMPGGITGLSSPSHPISLALENGHAVVTLATPEAALDRDFVLTADAAILHTPQAWVEPSAVAVGFVPDLPMAAMAAEIVFVVDRSGSMIGTSIAEVRNALQLCLRAMTADCCFNIVGFGSTFAPLFPESQLYDQASLERATQYVDGLAANLGGTEILPALQFVLASPSRSGLPRQVVVLTDGAVSNTDAVIALVREHRNSARVFTFGIGAAASQHLVKGMARAGGGTAEFIHPGERIEAKVMRQVTRLLSPVVTDVRLEWVGGSVTTAPDVMPAIFGDQRLLVYGLVTGAMPSAVRLSARGPSGPLSWDIAIAPATQHTAGAIETLAARARIRELEEGGEWLTARGSQQRDRRQSAVREQIIALSLRYSLLSRETSFVAVEHRTTPVHGDLQLRRVPVALMHGWGGNAVASGAVVLGAVDYGAPAAASASMAVQFMHSMQDVDGEAAESSSGYVERSMPQIIRRADSRAAGAFREWASRLPLRRKSSARPAVLDALVKLQAASGAWDLTEALAQVIGPSLAELRRAMPAASVEGDGAERAWATALALAWLEQYAAAHASEWRALADKARRWLVREPKVGPVHGASWQDAASVWLAAWRQSAP